MTNEELREHLATLTPEQREEMERATAAQLADVQEVTDLVGHLLNGRDGVTVLAALADIVAMSMAQDFLWRTSGGSMEEREAEWLEAMRGLRGHHLADPDVLAAVAAAKEQQEAADAERTA